MLPLKTLIVAAIIAIAFSPRLNACPAHNHLETAQSPTVAPVQVTVGTQAADATGPDAAEAQTAEVAVADQPASPAAN